MAVTPVSWLGSSRVSASLAHSAYDFVVVGAGSAGSIIASQLGRTFRIGLIESGSVSPGSVFMRRPADFLKTFDTPDDWGYWTVPQSKLAGRSIRFPRGKGLGGSTRINASIWLPPTDSDFEQLHRQLGETIPLASLHQALQQITDQVSPEHPRWLSQPASSFLSTTHQLGFTASAYRRMNRRGVRVTAADGRLSDSGSDVEIIPNATAHRIVLNDNRVTAVETETPDGHFVVPAKFGVVLAAGAIGSPSLLLRSGMPSGLRPKMFSNAPLGPDEPRAEFKEIGTGLRDHLVIPVVYRTKKNVSLPATWAPNELAQWQSLGTGPIAGNIAEAGCLIDSPHGPIQIFVTATNYLKYPHHPSEPSMSFGVVVSKPQSTGTVTLASNAAPTIDPGYWTCESDTRIAFEGLQIVRKLARTGALADLCEEEIFPGKRADTDANFMRIAGRGAQSLYHPVGTCSQGATDASPVDTEFRLRNVDGLWIADASILGFIPTSNPNPLVMSLASLAAQRIKQAI